MAMGTKIQPKSQERPIWIPWPPKMKEADEEWSLDIVMFTDKRWMEKCDKESNNIN